MKGKQLNYSKIIGIIVAIIIIAGLFLYASTLSSEFRFTSPFSLLGQNEKVSILIVGDIMLDRNVRNIINKNGFDSFFGGVKNLISDVDIAVANLEGPFTINRLLTSSLKNKTLTFTFDPSLAPQLAELGFDVLGLANNHTLNFGKDGLASTRKYIKETDMLYYGEPNNKDETSTIIEKNGLRIGLIGFHEFSYINSDKILSEISRLRPEVDVLIVTPHWGNEYQKEPTANMQKWAHQFIDLGIDAVVGTHPHVVGDIEEYKGKKIFYSLGNFAFDQYFSEETMEGLAVIINIERENTGENKTEDEIKSNTNTLIHTENRKIDINYSLITLRVDREGVKVLTND